MAPPPSRPRDKGGTGLDVAAKEYALSNSTTAKFLGGLQKSWMLGNMVNLGHSGPASSQPPTGQPGPGLLRERSGNQQTFGTAVACQFNATFNSHKSSLNGRYPPDPPSLQLRALGQQSPKAHTHGCVDVGAVLPSPAPSDEQRPDSLRPPESAIDGQRSNVQTWQTQLNQPANSPGDAEGRNQQLQHTVSAITPPSSSVTPPYNQYASETIPNVDSVVSINADISRRKKRKRTPPRPITLCVSGSSSNTPSSSHHSLKHSTPMSSHDRPSDAQMRNAVETIIHRQRRIAGQNSAEKSTECARLRLLQSACEQHDHFYLLLHQIYCMYPRLVHSSHQLVKAGFHPEHFQGLELLTPLLLSNSLITNDATEWFAVFPFPFEKLLYDFPVYRKALKHVKSCLAGYAHKWSSFHELCVDRRYPPFVDELVSFFKVESPVLQSVVFRAILKDVWIGPMDDPCFDEAEKLFCENQQTLRQRSRPLSDAERQSENQNLVIRYQRIQATHLGHSQGNSSSNNLQTVAIQRTHVPQLPTYGQGRTQAFQHASHLSTSSNGPRNPMPSHINTQFAQHASASPARITPVTLPTVPSQPFLQEHNSPLILQDPARRLTTSHITTTSPTSMQAQMRRPNTGPPPMYPLHNSVFSPQRTPSCDPRSPQESWPPQAMISNHSSVILPVTTYPPHRQAAGSAPAALAQQSPVFHQFASQQPPMIGTNPPTTYQQPFFPMSGQIMPTAAQANPMLTALHQYHVRSPVLTAMDGSDLQKPGTKYFRYVKGINVIGDRLKIGVRQHLEWNFDFDEATLGLLSGTTKEQNGSLPRRAVQTGSAFCRVRCINASKLTGVIGESDWVAAHQVWPSNVTIMLNNNPLEIRKKNHYGKDLPVDITALVKEGTNRLSMSIIRAQKEDEAEYAVGIESIRLIDMEAAKALTQVLPYEEARQRIVQRFQITDPEIEVVDASIALNLTDPHTSRIWDVPMRSKSCLHDQCFDLGMFFETRNNKRPGQPCDPDQFKCPICNADARPQNLVKDEFFVILRQLLARQGRLDAKAIVMQQDGSWQIKEEERSGETGDGSGILAKPGENDAVNDAAEWSKPRKEIETIDLDDD